MPLATFKKLLPRSRAFSLKGDNKNLTKFMQVESDVLDVVIDSIKSVRDNGFAQTTESLLLFEKEYNLTSLNASDEVRRQRLISTIQDEGGPSPQSMQQVLRNAGFDVYVYDYFIRDLERLIGVSSQDGFFFSSNAGDSYTQYTTVEGLIDNNTNHALIKGPLEWWLTSENGLSISIDGGATFSTYDDGDGLPDKACRHIVEYNNEIYIATKKGIAKTIDASFFTVIDPATLTQDDIKGLAINSLGVITVATNNGVFISIDGGATFSNKTTADGLGNNTVINVFYDKNDILYAATDGGLSISIDGGATFSNKTTADGLGGNKTYDVWADGDNNIYISLKDNGVSISTDNGVTFSTVTTIEGLGNNKTRGIILFEGLLYVATDSGTSISITEGETYNNNIITTKNNSVSVGYGDFGPIVHNPNYLLKTGDINYLANIGADDVNIGSENAILGKTNDNLGYTLVNDIFIPDGGGGYIKKEYFPLVDPATFTSYMYIASNDFPLRAEIPGSRREEFENLIYKKKQAHLWVGVLVEYI